MLRRTLLVTGVVAVGFVLARCTLFDTVGVVDVTRIMVSLELDTATVAPGDSVDADAIIINTGPYATTIAANGDCLGTLSVQSNGIQQDFQHEPAACWSIGNEAVIEPGDTLINSWSVQATTSSGAPVALGEYQVVVHMSGRIQGGSDLPDVSRRLVVQ